MHEQLEEDPLNICEGFNATDETFPYASVADLRSARTDRDSLRTTKKDAAEREARLNLAIQLLYCQNEDLQNTLSDHRFYAECLRQKLKGWNYRSLSNLSRASPARTTTSHTHAPAIHSLTLPSAPSLSVEDASSNELSPNTSPSPNNIKKRSLPSAPEMTHPCPRPPEEKCEAHQPKRVKFCEDSIPNEERARKLTVSKQRLQQILDALPGERMLISKEHKDLHFHRYPKSPGESAVIFTRTHSSDARVHPRIYAIFAPAVGSDATSDLHSYFGQYCFSPFKPELFHSAKNKFKCDVAQWILQDQGQEVDQKNVKYILRKLENATKPEEVPVVVMQFIEFDKEVLTLLEEM